MAEETTQTTLRDTIEAAYDEHVTDTGTARESPPVSQPASSAPDKTDAGAATADKGAAGDDRPRGADGKFLPKDSKETKDTAPGAKAATPSSSLPQAASVAPGAVPAAPAAPAVPRPSSWKKDYDAAWAKIDPEVQKYVLQREGEFAKGVSTYKQEWDRAKPLLDAVSPHLAMFQQHGIDPAQQVSRYIEVHKGLAIGTPEQKLGMLLRIAQDYQIPVQNLFQQGQDGKVYYNPQVQPWQPPAQQQPAPQAQDIDALLEQKLVQREAVQSLAAFEREAPTKYQHYEVVKEDMARLLEAGFAQDYPGAYDAALRLPQHSDIFDALQEQQRAAKQAEKAKADAEAAQRARRQTVSPKSATPASKAAPSGKKDLRSQLLDAWDEHVDAGRV